MPLFHLSGFAALVASHTILVPVELENFAVRGLASIERDYRTVQGLFNPNITIHYYLSKVGTASKTQERSRNLLVHSLGEQNVFTTPISRMATFVSAINTRKPIAHHKPKSKAAKVISDFTEELIGVTCSHGNKTAA